MRYFRSTPDSYAVICERLDAAYGYPNALTKTARALPIASELPHDNDGRLYLSASVDECGYPAIAQLLPQLLASGAVEEISEAEYRAALPSLPGR